MVSSPVERVLIVVIGPVASDPRVLRQIDALSDSYDLTVAGYGPFEDSRVSFHSLGNQAAKSKLASKASRVWQLIEVILCALRLYRISFWLLHPAHVRFKSLLQKARFDLILVNDSEGVAVATKFARGNPVVIHDQHEYWPDLFINPLKRWAVSGYRHWYVREFLAPLPRWITVGEGIGELYRRNFGLSQPVIITNAPGYVDLEPSSTNENRIDLVYHGIWDPGRGIEVMIEALSMAPQRFHLNLIIVGSGKDHLFAVSERFKVRDRVHFLDPVPPRQIAQFISKFDVGLVLNVPVNTSEKFALPNKVFESIQGRLALISGPSPEIAKIVTDGKCGIVLKDFEARSLADVLRNLDSETIDAFKAGSACLAERLTAEENARLLREMIRHALDQTAVEL